MPIYVGEIPQRMRNRVFSQITLDPDEKVIMFCDNGLLMRATAGVLFSNRRIHLYGWWRYKVYEYAEVKELFLTGDETSLINSIKIVTSGETYNCTSVTPKERSEVVRVLSPYISVLAGGKGGEAMKARLTQVAQGVFCCESYPSRVALKGVRCYLVFPETDLRITLQDNGMHFSEAHFFRGGIASSVGRPRGIGVGSYLMTAVSAVSEKLFIPWSDVKEFSIITSRRPDTERVIWIFFHNRQKDRGEWLGLQLLSDEEWNLFLDAARRCDVRIGEFNSESLHIEREPTSTSDAYKLGSNASPDDSSSSDSRIYLIVFSIFLLLGLIAFWAIKQ